MMSFDMEMEDYQEDMELKNKPKNIFITGVSSGLGKALMEEYTNQGHTVYGITREDINLENVEEVNIKLPNILICSTKVFSSSSKNISMLILLSSIIVSLNSSNTVAS